MSLEDLAFRSATELLGLLRKRKIGAVELLKLHLERVEKHNPALNVVVAMDGEGALEAARKADNLPRTDLPPLHGLPMTIKDTYEVVGMPTTCGLPLLANHRPRQDAEAVARLKGAGAVVFGKTNVPPGAFDWQSYNPIYGTSNNPWDASRTPGGSSGGAAGAVAAGLTALELGSDIGGSIRCPAHFCGIYGHKPSHGVVPMRGHIPPLPGSFMRYELGVSGPMARSAADLELAMDVLVAPSELQLPAWSINIPPSRHERLQNFRVALWADDSTYAVDSQYQGAIEAFAQDLRQLGVKVDLRARPELDPQVSYETYLMTLLPYVGDLPQHVLQEVFDTAASLSPGNASYTARAARAWSMRHCEFFAVIEQRERLYRSWRNFFTNYDLVICPVMPTAAFPHDHAGSDSANPIAIGDLRNLMVNGRPLPYFDGLQWSSLATVADLPATSIPIGRFIDGLPMGVQLIGPRLEDRTPLRFAQLVEQALGGFKAPSGYASE